MLKFKNKLIMSIISLAVALSSMTVFADSKVQRFWDVDSSFWAFDYIADLAERKVINGYEDGSFRPNKTVSRAEWAKMMVDAANIQVSDNRSYFTDVPSGYWATSYINSAKQYLTGYKDGTFRPNQAATREDVAVAMVLLKGYDTEDVDYSYLTFLDNDTISNYAKAYVAVAVQHNLISGFTDGTFRGQDTLSRAQAATLIYKAFQQGSADKIVNPSVPANTSKDEEYKQQAESSSHPSSSDIDDSTHNDDKIDETDNEYSYSIDKLASAKYIKSVYDYTTDNRGNIYFVNGEYIDVVSIDSEEVSHFQYIPDLDIDGEDISLKDFNIYSLCWSVNDNTLIIQGSYNKINSVNAANVVNSFIIKSPGDEGYLELVNPAFESENNVTWNEGDTAHIIATTASGQLISNYQVWDESGEEIISDIVPESEHWVTAHTFTRCAANIGNNIYYITSADDNDRRSFYCYNFNQAENKFDITATAYALSNSGLYAFTDSKIAKINFNGKILDTISTSDVYIQDSMPLKVGNIQEKMISYEDSLVIYDNVMKAFRKIKKN